MRNLFGGLVLITFGTLFLLDNLDVADFGEIIGNYWPLILIFWGASILINPGKKRSSTTQINNSVVNQQYSSDIIHQSNVFGDVNSQISSTNFKGGSISTVFGDCSVDLTSASWSDGEHELKIHGVFGDTNIILPKGSAVTINANSTLGSLMIFGQSKNGFSSDLRTKTPEYESATGKLIIRITKVLGDVRVE
ncbi:MAG: cell wall-active antibiotics response protein [Ignavibacteriales bacterium]|nr:cell wall-active antibiotics response protein [Ignavibacteriales bacterium]